MSSLVLLVVSFSCMKVVFSPMANLHSLVSTALTPHKPVELSTEVVLGADEEQFLEVPGLLVRENFRGTSSG